MGSGFTHFEQPLTHSGPALRHAISRGEKLLQIPLPIKGGVLHFVPCQKRSDFCENKAGVKEGESSPPVVADAQLLQFFKPLTQALFGSG